MPDQWTPESVGSAGIIFFTVIGGIFLFKQMRRIWKYRSGQSVSVGWMLYFTFVQLVIFRYGLYQDYFPLMFNGLGRELVHIPILIGLYKYRGFSLAQRRAFVFLSLATVLFFFFPSKLFFFAFEIGFIFSVFLQFYELYREGKTGVLDIWMLSALFSANIFWNIYGLAVRDWALILTNAPVFIFLLSTIILWFYYRRREKTA